MICFSLSYYIFFKKLCQNKKPIAGLFLISLFLELKSDNLKTLAEDSSNILKKYKLEENV